MPMAHGTRGPIKVPLRPSSPSQAAKTVSTKRNVHRTSPPKALAACKRGQRKGEVRGEISEWGGAPFRRPIASRPALP